jgi:hypothetical protein
MERTAVGKKYQRKVRKSNHKFEVVGEQELTVRAPLPTVEVRAEAMRLVIVVGQAGYLRGRPATRFGGQNP